MKIVSTLIFKNDTNPKNEKKVQKKSLVPAISTKNQNRVKMQKVKKYKKAQKYNLGDRY